MLFFCPWGGQMPWWPLCLPSVLFPEVSSVPCAAPEQPDPVPDCGPPQYQHLEAAVPQAPTTVQAGGGGVPHLCHTQTEWPEVLSWKQNRNLVAVSWAQACQLQWEHGPDGLLRAAPLGAGVEGDSLQRMWAGGWEGQ